jgi:hypothetical protein
MSVRINARLDAELSRKLTLLRRRTAQSTTEVLKAALECYFERISGADVVAARAQLADFVGCADADEGLSTRYKAELQDSLDGKLATPRPTSGTRRRRAKAP